MTTSQNLPPLHVVFGSGGTKAVLAGAGAVLAFHIAEMNNFESIGAASGGSLPAALLADESPPDEFLDQVMETDITSLLVPKTGLTRRMLAMLNKYNYERQRPRRGVYATRKLRRFVNKLFPQWPERFWTVASCEHGQVLFTSKGVFKYSGYPRTAEKLRETPPSMGLAICASCAMPGLIDSVKFDAELLFDGALSGDGEVPVDVVQRHFDAENKSLTLAIDIGPDPIKNAMWLRALWTVFCGGYCETGIDGKHPEPRDGLIIVKPEITGFHALEFNLSRNLKWHAIIAGFVATANAICDNGLAGELQQSRLRWYASQLAALDRNRKRFWGFKKFADHVEAFMRAHGLMDEPEM